MTDLFQLQTDSNDLWPRIAQAIDEAKGELETVKAERDEAKALLTEARAAWDARDLGRIQNLVDSVDKSEAQKRIDELAAEIAEDKAELLKDEQELEKLKPTG